MLASGPQSVRKMTSPPARNTHEGSHAGSLGSIGAKKAIDSTASRPWCARSAKCSQSHRITGSGTAWLWKYPRCASSKFGRRPSGRRERTDHSWALARGSHAKRSSFPAFRRAHANGRYISAL